MTALQAIFTPVVQFKPHEEARQLQCAARRALKQQKWSHVLAAADALSAKWRRALVMMGIDSRGRRTAHPVVLRKALLLLSAAIRRLLGTVLVGKMWHSCRRLQASFKGTVARSFWSRVCRAAITLHPRARRSSAPVERMCRRCCCRHRQ